MAYKVFIDTNIIIDIWLKRDPFFDNSQKLVSEIVEKNFLPHISCSAVTDLYYICKKAGMEKDVLLKNLKELLEIFEVLVIDKNSIIDAISFDIKDFRNEWIEVQTPQDYLAAFQ